MGPPAWGLSGEGAALPPADSAQADMLHRQHAVAAYDPPRGCCCRRAVQQG